MQILDKRKSKMLLSEFQNQNCRLILVGDISIAIYAFNIDPLFKK